MPDNRDTKQQMVDQTLQDQGISPDALSSQDKEQLAEEIEA